MNYEKFWEDLGRNLDFLKDAWKDSDDASTVIKEVQEYMYYRVLFEEAKLNDTAINPSDA